MKNHPSISKFFCFYQDTNWWPYVAELVTSENKHNQETIALVRNLDPELATLLQKRWQLAMFCFCGWIKRNLISRQLHISGVEDAVILMHNYVMPQTATGEALRSCLLWADKKIIKL